MKAVFEPFTTIIKAEFWSLLARKKLDELRLNDDEIPIWGYYEAGRQGSDLPPIFHLSEESLGDRGGASVQGTVTTSTRYPTQMVDCAKLNLHS